MITLITGLPGAAKTLYTLAYVKALAEKEQRPVYHSGIEGLTLSWLPLGDLAAQVQSYVDPEDKSKKVRFTLPPNSIVVIDEAQRVFRPRGVGGAVPDHVAALETHRHGGIDLFLISQHPMLLDANVRRLVGRHLHVVRVFGMQRSTVHEWAECKARCDEARGDSVRHEFSFPREAFGYYKSAEVHTHKRNVPMRVIMLFALPVLAVLAGWWAFGRLGAIPGGKDREVKKDASVVAQGAIGRPAGKVGPGEWLAARSARLADFPESAPIFDGLASPKAFPRVVGCVASARRCSCYTQQGTILGGISKDFCLRFVKEGTFDLYSDPRTAKSGVSSKQFQEQGAAPSTGPGTPNPGAGGRGEFAPGADSPLLHFPEPGFGHVARSATRPRP